MFRYSLPRIPTMTHTLSRHLRLFTPTRPEIVIANNSGIFFSLASINMHGKLSHPNLHVILPKFWLDDAHSDYDDLDWGQTIRGIPWYAREEFLEIYPNHPTNKLITWKHYKELRNSVIHKITSHGARLSHGTPEIINHGDNGYDIKIGPEKFITPSNTFFYNSFRQPNVKHGISGCPEISHTSIYSLPKKEVPSKIIVVGSGRSTIWLCNHFPKTHFACIKQASLNYPLFGTEKLPSNLISYNRDSIGTDQEFEIHPFRYNDKVEWAIIDKRDLGRDFIGDFYSSIGLKPNTVITDCISKENLLVYPYDDKYDWFAPDILPVGSLMESTLRWAIATDNLSWAFETHCYHENYFIKMMIAQMEEKGIALSLTFFDLLRNEMLNYYNRQAKNPLNEFPCDEEAIKIYKACYSLSLPNLLKADNLDNFEHCLRDTLEERVSKYHKNRTLQPF